jgi:hypothetical protein
MKLDRKIERRRRKLLWFSWSYDQVIYITLEVQRYTRASGEVIMVPAGTETDGATVPWLVRWLYRQDGRYFNASVAHDHLYNRRIGSRLFADIDFLIWMLRDGVKAKTALVFFFAIVLGGKNWWKN